MLQKWDKMNYHRKSENLVYKLLPFSVAQTHVFKLSGLETRAFLPFPVDRTRFQIV